MTLVMSHALQLSKKEIVFTDPPIKTQHGYHIIAVEDKKL